MPPAVTVSGPGLLRFSLDNQTWEGVTGVDGVPIEYFDIIKMIFDRRPYVSETTGHLLGHTHLMLCENGFTIVNVATASGQNLFAKLKDVYIRRQARALRPDIIAGNSTRECEDTSSHLWQQP